MFGICFMLNRLKIKTCQNAHLGLLNGLILSFNSFFKH